MTVFTITKAQADALTARETGQDVVILLAKTGRRINPSEYITLKVGKKVVMGGVVAATALIHFTPIALRRVLEPKAVQAAGEPLLALLAAAEQGSPQADEHLQKLATAAGYERWLNLFIASHADPSSTDTHAELSRQVIVLTGVVISPGVKAAA